MEPKHVLKKCYIIIAFVNRLLFISVAEIKTNLSNPTFSVKKLLCFKWYVVQIQGKHRWARQGKNKHINPVVGPSHWQWADHQRALEQTSTGRTNTIGPEDLPLFGSKNLRKAVQLGYRLWGPQSHESHYFHLNATTSSGPCMGAFALFSPRWTLWKNKCVALSMQSCHWPIQAIITREELNIMWSVK